jgi:hypothetical protein
MRLAALVFVVAKNTRSLLSIASELAFRAGLAIAGAKSPSSVWALTARLKSCPDITQKTKAKSFFLKDFTLSIQKM